MVTAPDDPAFAWQATAGWRLSAEGDTAWRLAVARREPGQAARLARWEQDHPDLPIQAGDFGTLHTWIPDQDHPGSKSGRTIFGHTLKELLDKLDVIFAPEPPGDG